MEYQPNARWNKIQRETDPYSRYYKPPRAAGSPRPMSEGDDARIEELLRINTYERPLTQEEVNELRSYNQASGLDPIVRYSWSVGNYKTRKTKYKTNLKRFKNSRMGQGLSNRDIETLRGLKKNYGDLKRAENMLNYPHQLEAPENVPGENYRSISPVTLASEFVRVVNGGKRKTRKSKGSKGTRRNRRR